MAAWHEGEKRALSQARTARQRLEPGVNKGARRARLLRPRGVERMRICIARATLAAVAAAVLCDRSDAGPSTAPHIVFMVVDGTQPANSPFPRKCAARAA